MATTRRRPARRRPRYRIQTRRRKQTGRKRTVRHVKIRHRKRPTRIRAKMARMRTNRKIRMTRDAWGMLHSYVDGIYRKVSQEAERLRRKDQRNSIITSDVQSALRQVMPRKYNRRIAYSKTR